MSVNKSPHCVRDVNAAPLLCDRVDDLQLWRLNCQCDQLREANSTSTSKLSGVIFCTHTHTSYVHIWCWGDISACPWLSASTLHTTRARTYSTILQYRYHPTVPSCSTILQYHTAPRLHPARTCITTSRPRIKHSRLSQLGLYYYYTANTREPISNGPSPTSQYNHIRPYWAITPL